MGRMRAWGPLTRLLTVALPVAVSVALMVSGCSRSSSAGSPPPTSVAVVALSPAARAASTSPGTPSTAPTGPPPAAGTLARYIYDLPRFGPAPVPPAPVALPVDGPAAQFNSVPVGDRRVAFVTIDDGWTKDPDILTIMRAAHIPFTMFLTTNAIKTDPGFFKALEGAGGIIEGHTVSHPQLPSLTYDQQRREICDNRDTLASLYGRAPGIMRAPYGLSNATTLAAAGSCGIRANVFWNEYPVTGPVEYQRPGGIHPGDMVLMHFDQYLKANLMSTLQAFQRDGITPALLEDYLVTTPPAPTVWPPEPIV
jgi:peptidoglycan/xylan/chitin deacetylase (PgdA/CDA1 family)